MDSQTTWRAELKNCDVNVRATAAENLSLAGLDAVDAAVDLVRACGDEDAVRDWAVAALEDLGPPRNDAAQPLASELSAANPLVAYWAATLLGRLGTEAAGCQKALAKTLTHATDLAVRERSAWALGKIGATSNEAVAALQAAAESNSARLSRLAETALGTVGK
jgi:hypothetical protein